jgi:hypothetical protein
MGHLNYHTLPVISSRTLYKYINTATAAAAAAAAATAAAAVQREITYKRV